MSGNDDAFVARFDSIAAVPVAPTLISPSGTIADTAPTYTWYAVPTATSYHLWVNDSGGNNTINQWDTAAAAVQFAGPADDITISAFGGVTEIPTGVYQ